MAGRALVWVGGLVAVAASAGLGVHFAVVGLDEADKLASVLGLFVALTGLAVAVYGLTMGGGHGRQALTDSRVGGSVTQVRGGESVRIHRSGPRPEAPRSAPAADRTGMSSGPQSDQSVTRSEVAGNLDQVDGARGDVDIQEEM